MTESSSATQSTAGAVTLGSAIEAHDLRQRKSRNTVWGRFRRHKLAMVGLTTLVIFCLAAILAPVIAPHEPNFVDIRNIKKPPSADHWLGTDSAGRDVLSRLIFGARISMSVGVVAVTISAAVVVLICLVSGFAGGFLVSLRVCFS